MGAVLISLTLELIGIAEAWYVREEFEPFLPFDRTSYWLPLESNCSG